MKSSILDVTKPPISTTCLTDHELWTTFKKGNQESFSYIYQRHFKQLFRYGLKVTDNHDLIQDCIQDLFVELWENRETITLVHSIQFYLLKSLRYKIIRQTTSREIPFFDSHLDLEQESDFETLLVQQETTTLTAQKLTVAINHLPKRQREAIELRYLHSMNNEQVAQIMGVNYQSACKFIYTGLKTLRQLMHLSSWLPALFFSIN